MKGVIAWFADNHVAANLLMLFLILAGIVTGLTMKLEIFPEYSMDQITITTTYPGASPAEIEEAVVRRIEERIAGLSGVKRIDSVAREGLGVVTVEVMADWDLAQLLDEVKAEIDRITTFPDEAEKPVVREVTRRAQVIDVAVYGDIPGETLKKLAEKIKDDITNLEGVTQAEIFGLRSPEIHIEISEATLRRYGLTLGAVAQAVAQASLDLPAGSIKTRGGEILIRTKGRRYWAADYRDVAVITRPDGSKVTLEQIARLSDGFEETDIEARFLGQPAVMLQVFRVADQNALDVAEAVKTYIETVRPTLPEGARIDFFADMSEMLRSRISLLLKNMGMGLILVALLLGLFLDRRLAFWVTLGIPVSFLSALIFLPSLDVSINMISLFAFILVLGIVVDDAIVIGENIYRKQEEGLPPLKAAVEGTREVGLPVIFSVLTTIVAFAPLLLGGGMMGKIMRNMPVVVILVLTGSLIESLLILPAHLNSSHEKALRRRSGPSREKRTVRWLKGFIDGPYSRFLDFCLRWRYAVMALALAVLLLTLGTWTGGLIKFTFFPKVESDVLQCYVTMPTGTPAERTTEVVTRLENAAREALAEADRTRPAGSAPLFKYSFGLVGLQIGGRGGSLETGGHVGQVWINLLEGEERNYPADDLVQAWRKKIGHVPDAESITFQSDIFSAGNPVEIHLSLDDNDLLLAAAEELKTELRHYPGVFDVADSFQPGKPEMQLRLEPSARGLGLRLNDLALQVRHAFYGAEALRLLRDQDEVKVMVRYPESERRSLGHIDDMRILTPLGGAVAFHQVARVDMEQGYAAIRRAQRRRVIKVTADVDEKITNANEVRQALFKKFMPELVRLHPGLRYTIEGEGKEQKESLADVFRAFLVAMFCIYALLAVPFRSFGQPLIVMFAIPFGIVGAIAGHLFMGFNISLVSLLGVVGLTGVVVNDSLVLIHAANRFREDGLTAGQAIVQAAGRRFRAIILTSLTTFAGLTPIILERSLQAQFIIPMAVALGFGVMFATAITLLLIPCGYLILEDLHRQAVRLLGGRPEPVEETAPPSHTPPA
ncbi:MAG: efflux RND transporter permease subunit [Proteobacteria bacterium]|nr:efflux RND transporter permease subunit [Pseudomonadota bacterium]